MATPDRSIRRTSIRKTLLATSLTVLTWPALAADVTPQRLINADKEPQNWLMNHRTYDGQRFSPLARISRDNVRGLKLAYAVPLGGGAGNEFNEATPLAEDGFLYITDSWGVLYKIVGTSGDAGRIVWRMDPKQEQQRQSRGAALWGNLVITAANGPGRVIATDKETGKVVWETTFPEIERRRHHHGAARHQGQDHRRRGQQRRRHPRLDRGARCRHRQAGLAEIQRPGAGRTRPRHLEGRNPRLADRRRRRMGHRHLRRRDQPDHLGHRQSGADVRPDLSPWRQPLHQQRDLVRSRHRQDELVLPSTRPATSGTSTKPAPTS